MLSEDAVGTRVYYHLDDSTPYMSVVPVAANAITLGDFKKVFGRRGYTYFCKKFDSALNDEVKEALTSDAQRLHKSANGHIELFLFSQNAADGVVDNGALGVGTLPRFKHQLHSSTTVGFPTTSLKLNKRRSSALALSSIVDEMDVCGGQRVSMVTNERSMSGEASSDINTLISKRAGEHLADIYTSTSEDPYKFDITSMYATQLALPSFGSSTNYGQLLLANDDDSSSIFYTNANNHRQRKPRKQKYRKAYVPSTISSASESSMSTSLPRVDEVKIPMQEGVELGISVACSDGCIFISQIEPGSAAEKCGRLEIGDQIVQVGKISFETLGDEEAVNEIRKACRSKRPIKIYVAKRPRVSDQKSDALSLLCETMQMNVSEWVEQTIKQDADPPFDEFPLNETKLVTRNGVNFIGGRAHLTVPTTSAQERVADTEFCTGNETSDEERAAYADRRNGVGPTLVPALHNKKRAAAAATLAVITSASAVSQLPAPPIPAQQPPAFYPQVGNYGLSGRSNGDVIANVGAQLPLNCMAPMVCEPSLSNDLQLPAVFRSCDKPNKRNALTVRMDPLAILRHMARPDSGLVIKDRKWLKIPVPNSFIGDEMVNWLWEHVSGFRDRKAVKIYASMLLSKGYIKHVVNMSSFNEKCYYIFDDSIISERIRLLQQPASQSTLVSTNTTSTRVGSHNGNITATLQTMPESTTEITYMSSPSSPFFLTGQNSGGPAAMAHGSIQLQPVNDGQTPQMNVGVSGGTHTIVKMANNPRYVSPPSRCIRNELIDRLTDANNNNLKMDTKVKDPTVNRPLTSRVLNGAWPISPIPMLNTNNNNYRDCDSPAMTNEYASVIQGEINAGAQFDTFDNNGILRPKENNPPGQLPPIPPPISASHNAGTNGVVTAAGTLSQKSFIPNLFGH